jgi:hypothetical protein
MIAKALHRATAADGGLGPTTIERDCALRWILPAIVFATLLSGLQSATAGDTAPGTEATTVSSADASGHAAGSAGADATPNPDASERTPDVLGGLLGTWRGEGTLLGKPSEFTMTWAPALGGQFVRLQFSNRLISAEAFYRITESGSYEGVWLDSRGQMLPLTAEATESVLETQWGSADTESGRTTYRLVGPTEVEVADVVLHNGEWVPFGNARYHRADPGESPRH